MTSHLTSFPSEEIEIVSHIAKQASLILLSYFRSDIAVTYKDKKEPVTIADQKANDCILELLNKYFPDDGLISEEKDISESMYQNKKIWFVDPLDGTKRFIKGEDDFSIMIGRVENGVPNLGVVFMPAQQKMFFGQAEYGTFLKTSDQVRRLYVNDALEPLVLTISRTASFEELTCIRQLLPVTNVISISSVGVKIGKLLEHSANLYLHLNGHTKVWDSCAPQAIYTSAGGVFTDLHGNQLNYLDPKKTYNSFGLVACSHRSFEKIITAIRPLAEKLQPT